MSTLQRRECALVKSVRFSEKEVEQADICMLSNWVSLWADETFVANTTLRISGSADKRSLQSGICLFCYLQLRSSEVTVLSADT